MVGGETPSQLNHHFVFGVVEKRMKHCGSTGELGLVPHLAFQARLLTQFQDRTSLPLGEHPTVLTRQIRFDSEIPLRGNQQARAHKRIAQ